MFNELSNGAFIVSAWKQQCIDQ